jgi:hypothetical protein
MGTGGGVIDRRRQLCSRPPVSSERVEPSSVSALREPTPLTAVERDALLQAIPKTDEWLEYASGVIVDRFVYEVGLYKVESEKGSRERLDAVLTTGRGAIEAIDKFAQAIEALTTNDRVQLGSYWTPRFLASDEPDPQNAAPRALRLARAQAEVLLRDADAERSRLSKTRGQPDYARRNVGLHSYEVLWHWTGSRPTQHRKKTANGRDGALTALVKWVIATGTGRIGSVEQPKDVAEIVAFASRRMASTQELGDDSSLPAAINLMRKPAAAST